MSIIETGGSTKYCGKTRGIEDVALTVEGGEIFGSISPNGAGKDDRYPQPAGVALPHVG